jgi:hypothetical protein
MQNTQPIVIYTDSFDLSEAARLSVEAAREYELKHNAYPRVEYIESHPWDYGVDDAVILFFVFFQPDSIQGNIDDVKTNLKAVATAINSGDPSSVTTAQLSQYITETGSLQLGI